MAHGLRPPVLVAVLCLAHVAPSLGAATPAASSGGIVLSAAPPARISFRFEGVWRRGFPLDGRERVLDGDRLLGFMADRAVLTDGISIRIIDADRGTALGTTRAPMAFTTSTTSRRDDFLLIWQRPEEHGGCWLSAYDVRRLRQRWRQSACDFVGTNDDERLGAASATSSAAGSAARLLLAPLADRSGGVPAVASRSLVAVDAVTGKVAWRRTMPAAIEAVEGEGARFYVASRENVSALDAATGAPLWEVRAADGAPASRAAADLPLVLRAVDGDLFVAVAARVSRLDGATGAPRWTRPIGFVGVPMQLVARAGLIALTTTHEDGFVGAVVALDAATGAVRWAHEHWQPLLIGVLAGGGLLVTGIEEEAGETLSLLDETDGAVLARLTLGPSGSETGAIASGDGRLVVRGGDGDLMMGMRLRPTTVAPPPSARIAGAVEVCFERSCKRRAGASVVISSSEDSAPAPISTDARVTFTRGLLVGVPSTAVVAPATLRQIEGELDRARVARPAKARAFDLTYLGGRVLCSSPEPSTFFATRPGEVAHLVLRVSCRVIIPD